MEENDSPWFAVEGSVICQDAAVNVEVGEASFGVKPHTKRPEPQQDCGVCVCVDGQSGDGGSQYRENARTEQIKPRAAIFAKHCVLLEAVIICGKKKKKLMYSLQPHHELQHIEIINHISDLNLTLLDTHVPVVCLCHLV